MTASKSGHDSWATLRYGTRWVALLLVLGQSVVWAEPPAYSRVTYEEFRKGNFRIPVGEEARIDPEAEQRILDYIRLVEVIREANRKQRVFLPEWLDFASLPNEFEVMRQYKLFLEHWDLLRKTAGTEANLTGILLLAIGARSWDDVANRPVITALEEVRLKFPNSWQALLAPAFEAGLMVFPRKTPDAERRDQIASMDLLKETMPAAGVDFDRSLPQAKAVLFFRGVPFPLRAWHLNGILSRQYTLAFTGPELDMEYVAAAQATCRQIMSEFPGTKHAESAKDILEKQIPGILESRKAAKRR